MLIFIDLLTTKIYGVTHQKLACALKAPLKSKACRKGQLF